LSASTALLVSSEPLLIESCAGLADEIEGLGFVAIEEIGQAPTYLHQPGISLSLIILHLTHPEQYVEARGLLRQLSRSRPHVAVLVIGEPSDAPDGLALLRQGAADFLTRPVELNRLGYLMDCLTVRARRQEEYSVNTEPVCRLSGQEPFLYLPSTSMGRLMEQVQILAPQETTVLLGGETGTGKTRLARLMHELSPRRDEPFLVVQCSALAPTLIESEIFGHVKGAFTGADRDRVGKFAAVGRGTLLLDDIDTLPAPSQGKLLRAVEERVFEPVGSNKVLPVQARLIVASNRSLDHEVASGRFRADLFYRLNVVGLCLPALRERPALIRHLVAQFIGEFAARNSRPVRSISNDALAVLEEHAWPGNIRELRNVIERAVALCPRSEIGVEDLPDSFRTVLSGAGGVLSSQPKKKGWVLPTATLSQARGKAELTHIVEALKRHDNNRLRAAAELGISRMTLYNKLQKYGLMNA
jgi:DNA-binding NtrC family response regulator